MSKEQLPELPVTVTMTDFEWAKIAGAASALVTVIHQYPGRLPAQIDENGALLEKFVNAVHVAVWAVYESDAFETLPDIRED